MQAAVRGEDPEKSRIVKVPFIKLNPSKLSIIYSALSFVQLLYEKHNLGCCTVTFDQPL